MSLIPLRDGRLGAIWLDGRNMKDMKDDHDEDKPLPANMTLRYAAIDASGKIKAMDWVAYGQPNATIDTHLELLGTATWPARRTWSG